MKIFLLFMFFSSCASKKVEKNREINFDFSEYKIKSIYLPANINDSKRGENDKLKKHK